MDEKIKRHVLAARKLELIKNKTFRFIRKNINKISEYEVKQFILLELEKQGFLCDSDVPITGVNQNAAIPHYFPKKKSKIIKKNNLILIDVWARLRKGYFADMTWMGYSGKKIPIRIQKVFNLVIGARDFALRFIKGELRKKILPKGVEVDKVVRDYFKEHKIDKFFLHGTGHSLGLRDCHGRYFNLNKKGKKRIKIGIPFTIEPGIYFKNKFGIRSEIDCYVSKDYKLIISTKRQRKIVLV